MKRVVKTSHVFPLLTLSSPWHPKHNCYENDFTLPNMPSLLTVISDKNRGSCGNLSWTALLSGCATGARDFNSGFNRNLSPFLIFTPCQKPSLLKCEPSHLKLLRLLQRQSFIMTNRSITNHKGRKCELVFGRGDKKFGLFYRLLCQPRKCHPWSWFALLVTSTKQKVLKRFQQDLVEGWGTCYGTH